MNALVSGCLTTESQENSGDKHLQSLNSDSSNARVTNAFFCVLPYLNPPDIQSAALVSRSWKRDVIEAAIKEESAGLIRVLSFLVSEINMHDYPTIHPLLLATLIGTQCASQRENSLSMAKDLREMGNILQRIAESLIEILKLIPDEKLDLLVESFCLIKKPKAGNYGNLLTLAKLYKKLDVVNIEDKTIRDILYLQEIIEILIKLDHLKKATELTFSISIDCRRDILVEQIVTANLRKGALATALKIAESINFSIGKELFLERVFFEAIRRKCLYFAAVVLEKVPDKFDFLSSKLADAFIESGEKNNNIAEILKGVDTAGSIADHEERDRLLSRAAYKLNRLGENEKAEEVKAGMQPRPDWRGFRNDFYS